MNVPKRGVFENNIRDDDVSRILELDKVWSSELQGSSSPHVPPNSTLSINCPILT